ncbi:hypothetical protein NB311A_06698 [Nitrobacter sp. Nb-311A]|uniref:HigA family addiction module antitoxin n=1 Tax=unclassified Nitrobacter TaxID=2620411 RepID=UPI000068717D|nr:MULTISPECIES: HigA family addiction module antitoxin [unclassified Nitrobacter]EAQ34067.1 hypothetical protein NB311A_06698 [Nitrobacter sp. Nb-311A]MCB1393894.1 HigA family addiction module antidote protein [Nitrobacter sp.]MCV0387993.1 HigA family addiction module antidote protein [Nitrobacter sp.]
MSEHKATRNKDRCPSHPGAVIADILDDIDISKTEIASRLDLSRQHLYDLLAGRKPLSPQAAVKVAKALGGSPESWLRMQAAYDAWHATREVDVSHIRPIKAA